MVKRCLDDIHFQDHVVIHEVGRVLVIGQNAAHFRRGQKHVFRLLFLKKCFHQILTAQVQLLAGALHQLVIALALQRPANGASHHASMTRHINFRILFHHNFRL